MGDKTFYIIISAINVMIWIVVVDWMRRINNNYINFISSIIKDLRHISEVITADEKEVARAILRSDKMIAKGEEYYHKTFQQFSKMTQTNISAASQFIAQISDIILSGENKGKLCDEKENRK